MTEGESTEIWISARVDAMDKFGEAALSGMPEEFVANNPYARDTEEHDEYEAAFEHYIMTALGY